MQIHDKDKDIEALFNIAYIARPLSYLKTSSEV